MYFRKTWDTSVDSTLLHSRNCCNFRCTRSRVVILPVFAVCHLAIYVRCLPFIYVCSSLPLQMLPLRFGSWVTLCVFCEKLWQALATADNRHIKWPFFSLCIWSINLYRLISIDLLLIGNSKFNKWTTQMCQSWVCCRLQPLNPLQANINFSWKSSLPKYIQNGGVTKSQPNSSNLLSFLQIRMQMMSALIICAVRKKRLWTF